MLKKQMKTLRISNDVRKLMDKSVKVVAVKTNGEVLGINAALEHILKEYLVES
jgi:hypothetical protein